jgi:MFS family permease
MDDTRDPPDAAATAALPNWLAIVLVVGTSASVLVLEILAGRMLAPYVGVSLETYTGIIATVLAGIALGAAAGGSLADRHEPRRLLPLLLVFGGALAIASIPLVRIVGSSVRGSGGSDILMLSAVAFLPSASVLSAVPPVVVKAQLRDLGATGTTVGRLSAYGTAGAIVGTLLTGFVLVASAAVTTLIVAVGGVLVVAGVALWIGGDHRAGAPVLLATGLAGVALVGVTAIDPVCDEQTRYYCLSVREDPGRPSGRTLVLDDLRHSYVDLDDPRHLEFWYVRRLVDGIDVQAPTGPIDVVYLGGGGLTLPRYLRAARPGSDQTVLEIDADLVRLVQDELGFTAGDDVDFVIGDGRLSMADRPPASADVVVGDAFGSRAVPWHLTTEEFLGDIHHVLRPGGVYVANLIDAPGQRFLRAEAATLAGVFEHVVVILGPDAAGGRRGNSVIIASDSPIDTASLDERRRADGDDGEVVVDLAAFIDDAPTLTDDYAPVDQLIAAGV